MKPERLFQMMDEISPDYIAEGKPAFTRTRPAKQHTPRRNPAQEEVFLSVQKPVQKRRKENTLKGSVIQRLTTGLVAAAALTVFVGTGVFIAKQEKDKQALSSAVPAAEIAEQATKNFLGGTGKLRALQPILGLNRNRIIYDDDFLYFNDSVNSPAGIYRVPRNSPQQTEDTFQEIGFNENLSATDNGQFFVCDGGKLYAIAQDGTKTLFFDAAQINLQADFEIKDYVYLNIKHICDDAYIFYFHALDNIAEEGANKLQKCACLYHAESNKTEILENSLLNDMNWEYLLPDGKNGFYVCAAAPQNGSPQLYHYTVGETVTKNGLFDEDTVIVPSSMYLSPDGGTLYFCSEYNSTLRKYDLNAGGESTVVLNEVPSQDYQYVVNDGTVSYFHSGCKEICCSDLEWTTHEVLWSADDSKLPAELANAYQSEKTLHWLPLGVDDNYLYVSFSSDAPETVGILDRKTGEMRYLKFDYESNKLTEEETKQQNEESSVQEAKVQTADSNIFGGKGELRVVAPYLRSGAVLRDDTCYYSGLTAFNEEGGTSEFSPTYHGHTVITDGEKLYTTFGEYIFAIDENGSETLFYTMKDICKYHGETCEIIALDKSPYVVTITTLMHVYNDVYMIAGSAFDSKTEESLPFGYFFCHDKISDASHSEYGGYFCLPEYLVNSDALMGDMIVAPEKMGFYCCYDEHIVFVNCYDGKPIEGYDYRTHRIVSPYQDNVVPGSWTIKDNILYYLNKKGEFCKHVISDDAVVYLNDITGTPKPTKEQYAKNTEKTVLSAPEGRLDALIFDGNTVYAITDFNCIWYTQINDTKSWKKLMDRRFQTDAIDSLSDCSFAVDGRLFVMNCESRERNCTRILEAKFYVYLLGEGTEQQTEESSVQEAASSLAAQK